MLIQKGTEDWNVRGKIMLLLKLPALRITLSSNMTLTKLLDLSETGFPHL